MRNTSLKTDFVAGSGVLGGLVPPIAGARLRRIAGHESMAGYLIASDTWQMLMGRFLKARSKVLELGCGCGEVVGRWFIIRTSLVTSDWFL